jgi:hypothetical protein
MRLNQFLPLLHHVFAVIVRNGIIDNWVSFDSALALAADLHTYP